MHMDGLDKRVRICDAYMFSSPIVSDMDSAKRKYPAADDLFPSNHQIVFNESLLKGVHPPRTSWRLVNVRSMSRQTTINSRLE